MTSSLGNVLPRPLSVHHAPRRPSGQLSRHLKVLFFVEGFTDIRFVVGLSRVCDLTLAVPKWAYRSSGLEARLAESGAQVTVDEVPGNRLAFQVRSLSYLLRRAAGFDVILAQEVLRGALNANLAGRLLGVPVAMCQGMPPLQYFRCRRERQQISAARWRLGDTVLRGLLALNGRLASAWLPLGPYLRGLARCYTSRLYPWHYYGVDTDLYCPQHEERRRQLRTELCLPRQRFLILFSSRVSHEKDPETVLQAADRARRAGMDLAVLNLGGDYQAFCLLARKLGLGDAAQWVLGRPAAHPMKELAAYYQTADLLAQASLEEGLGLSPLEALACGTPVVATAVGGMAEHLQGYAQLTPRRDPEAMACAFLKVASNPGSARTQALRARQEYILPEWNRDKAFADLAKVLGTIADNLRS